MVGSGANPNPNPNSNPNPNPNPNPKILLTKPASSRPDQGGGSASAPHHVVKLMRINDHRADDDLAPAASAAAAAAAARSNRLSLHGSLSLISESWEIYPDRLLPLLSENTDFTVIGVLGAPGVGKSTIMNELYGFDSISPGVPPPFSVLSDEAKAMARHCSVGVELRMCAERFILLDTQPLFSASILADLMRPDGSSSISVLTGESLSAELAHEMMGIQLGVFLASVCHVLLLVAEGLHDISLWRLMLTVEMLKQGIPDPSLINVGSNGSHVHQISGEKDDEDGIQEDIAEFFADTIFIHTKLREHECSWYNIKCLKKALSLYFPAPAFRRNGAVQYVLPQFSSRAQVNKDPVNPQNSASGEEDDDKDKDSEDEEKGGVSYFVLPLRSSDDAVKLQHESYTVMLGQLRDQILNMNRRPFARPMSERDWLRNSARIWDSIKKSPVLVDYCKTLQHSGLYRR